MKDSSIEALLRHLKKGAALIKKGDISKPEYYAWQKITHDFLTEILPSASDIKKLMDIGKFTLKNSIDILRGDTIFEIVAREHLKAQIPAIESLLDLRGYNMTVQPSSNQSTDTKALKRFKRTKLSQKHSSTQLESKIFLVHGKDNTSLHAVARFVEQLGFKPIVLHEQPNDGRTIIEKLEDYSDVAYAIVLLTPDDQGGLFKAPYETQVPRARQNVILELGYFLGILGRHRICILYRLNVDIPSEFTGVLFILFDDNGAWRLSLAKEMKSAGLNVDLNKAFPPAV